MPIYYNYRDINLGSNQLRTGHAVFPNARYQPRNAEEPQHIIYKKNKKDNPELTRFEAGFGELARLFLPSHLTPHQTIVKDDDGNITGLASENIRYSIARREALSYPFYEMALVNNEIDFQILPADQINEVPFYFLSNYAPGFFSRLCKAAEQREITLDMRSLAHVLTTAYSLEEDDLHRGNFGFYVVQYRLKPHVVFFKIDHDLMMADSVMSHLDSRFLNWFNGSDAFQVTARDLIDFPTLIDSKNFYWPAVKYSVDFNAKVAYSSDADVQEFKNLANCRAFTQHKWLAFYKHVLIPPVLIRQSLAKHFDENDPEERAKMALITQAVVARQAKLRAVLFTIPAFRQCISHLPADMSEDIVTSINKGEHNYQVQQEVAGAMARYKALCDSGVFSEGDTPMHAAIRLQDYRYQDTWGAFGHFADQKNAQGQTALDVATELALKNPPPPADMRADAFATMKHLLREGVTKTVGYQDFRATSKVQLQQYFFKTEYPQLAREATTAARLKEIIRNVGEDYRLSLKMQKDLAIVCVRQFIQHHHKDLKNDELKDILTELKTDINNSPECQYIRQLRSQLWIVRLLRGLFGGTSTKKEINKMIDKEINELSPKSGGWFFSAKANRELPVQQVRPEEEADEPLLPPHVT